MAAEAKKVILISADGERFEIEEIVAMESQLLHNMIEDGCAETAIPLSSLDGKILAKVIEYCKKHIESSPSSAAEAELKTWDTEFMKDVDKDTLYDLIAAANYLNIKGLLDLTCQTVADMIKGKTPDQIRRIFNIKNDFSPEEEAEIKKEHEWAFG